MAEAVVEVAAARDLAAAMGAMAARVAAVREVAAAVRLRWAPGNGGCDGG